MRKARFIGNCRCYHLISRLAHQAFFLDDDEKTRAVDGEMEPGKMTVDGTLTFGPESTFEVANAAALKARKGDLGKAYVLVEATEIVGCPAIGDSAKEARWEVSVSGDRKQLLLSRAWKGTVLIFR